MVLVVVVIMRVQFNFDSPPEACKNDLIIRAGVESRQRQDRNVPLSSGETLKHPRRRRLEIEIRKSQEQSCVLCSNYASSALQSSFENFTLRRDGPSNRLFWL
jgi:hypothetical protein